MFLCSSYAQVWLISIRSHYWYCGKEVRMQSYGSRKELNGAWQMGIWNRKTTRSRVEFMVSYWVSMDDWCAVCTSNLTVWIPPWHASSCTLFVVEKVPHDCQRCSCAVIGFRRRWSCHIVLCLVAGLAILVWALHLICRHVRKSAGWKSSAWMGKALRLRDLESNHGFARLSNQFPRLKPRSKVGRE